MPVPSQQLRQARQRAMLAAMREHEALDIDVTKRIDIFGILKQRNIQTMFQPLDSLYGAYVRSPEGVHGILINVKHPMNLQRFTAAHEYAHLVLHHGQRVDREEHILASKAANTQEIEAQAFAAHFLMPRTLINRCLDHIGRLRDLEAITPVEVYHLSLWVGVSYTAVVNHLASHNRISSRAAAQLQRTTPKAIKYRLSGGKPPQNSWADVWTLSFQDADSTILLNVDDEIHLSLSEAPELEGHWQYYQQATQSILHLADSYSELIPSAEKGEKSSLSYNQRFVLRAQVPGTTTLLFQKEGQPQELFQLTVEVLPRNSRGLYTAQHYVAK